MLDFENQILLDLLEEDGLLVLAKGLGLERILQGLVAAHSAPGGLVLVVGAGVQEAEWVAEALEAAGGPTEPESTPVAPPRCITADLPVPERSAVYQEGGVLFVSSRILVVDLLLNRVPAALISGIIVWKAHKILESCQEAFILRLYRQKNKPVRHAITSKSTTDGRASQRTLQLNLDSDAESTYLPSVTAPPLFQTGFIKALSDNAVSFTQGLCHVSRVMRNLFVRRLYLFPRFHITVNDTLESRKPEVVELHLRMTPSMQAVQTSLVDLVAATVHELRLVNKGLIDNDLLTPEVALSPLFERVVASLLQPVWEQLGTRVRTLVGDLRLLRTLSNSLSQYDCVTFYNLTASLRTTERAMQSAGWMMLPPAETLFLSAKKRVFGDNPSSALVEATKQDGNKQAEKKPGNPLDLTLEVNPKWECLAEVLAEVRESARQTQGPLAERCLIVTQDDATAQQLNQVLVDGPERVLQKIFYQTIGSKMNLTPPAHLFGPADKESKKSERRKKRFSTKRPPPSGAAGTSGDQAKRLKPEEDSATVAEDAAARSKEGTGSGEGDAASEAAGDAAAPENKGIEGSGDEDKTKTETVPTDGVKETETVVTEPGTSSGDVTEHGKEKLDETITLTQIHEKYKFVGESSDSESEGDDEETREQKKEAKRQRKEKLKKKDEEKKRRKNLFSSPLILIRSLKNYSDPLSLPRTLREVQPRYVVLYDADLVFIRQLEVWQAEGAPHQCLVYLMVYKGTTEEQLYLTQVKREKDAFHYLIKEKASLVFPEHAEGRTEEHPDLQRDPRSAADRVSEDSNAVTRKGGQTAQEEEKETRIIVDMREFRSELPALLHRRGIEIDPVTIEVGDYILSPEMCVERKSLSDLVGSLNNGRLYSQALSMTRHYAKPMLLIEFDQNKPFHLQASVLTNSRGASNFGALTQGEPDNRDVSAKLQLLTIHFPRLRVLWCSSPYATAEMFHLLKAGKAEPDVATAQAIKSDSCPLDELEKFNPIIHDFVSKLPGITTKNIGRVLRGARDLPALMALDKTELGSLLDNSGHGDQLHAALHATLREEDILQDAAKGGRGGARGKTRRGLPKFAR